MCNSDGKIWFCEQSVPVCVASTSKQFDENIVEKYIFQKGTITCHNPYEFFEKKRCTYNS